MSLLNLKEVTKIYQEGKIEVPALRGINLSVTEGEFSTVFGPSGSGKTTLLNLIGALDVPTTGTVAFDGKSLNKMNKNDLALLRRENIGFIFQSFNLIPVLSAYENVEFALRIARGKEGKTTKDKVMQILDKVGLKDMANRRPNELSGGQKQRVAIARALVKEPKLVLADEPTANLDSDTSSDVLENMVHMNEELDITFIFYTHDPLVMEYAHRMIEIKDGLITKDERR